MLLILYSFNLISQSLNTVSKMANCFLDIGIIEQFDFETNAERISGFEHISWKIEKLCLELTWVQLKLDGHLVRHVRLLLVSRQFLVQTATPGSVRFFPTARNVVVKSVYR